MKKLTKEQITKKTALVDELNEANTTLEDAVANFNEVMNKTFGDVESARILLNEILDKARDFASEVGGDIQAYAEEKSEKWQESEAGERYTDWQRVWEDLDLPDAEIEEPEELCVDDGIADAINELSEAPESVDDV